MVAFTMLPSTLVVLISALIGQIEAAPLPQVIGQTVYESNPTPCGPGSGSWQSAWPYIGTWPAQTTAAATTTALPTTAPTSPTFTTTPQIATSVTSLTFTTGTTIYTTYTAQTTTIVVGQSSTTSTGSAAQVLTSTLTTKTTKTKKSKTSKHTTTTTSSSTTSSSTSTTSSTTSTITSKTSTSTKTSKKSVGVPTTATVTTSVVTPPTASATTLATSIVVPTAPPTATTTSSGPSATLSMSIVNNLGVENAHAYLTGVDVNGALVMLTTDGTFYTPTTDSGTPVVITANVALPLAEGANSFTIPGYISSARVWFSEGDLQFSAVATSYGVGLVEPTVTNINDPSEPVEWGFVELTYNSELGLFANLSFVDFVGLAVGMSLTTTTTPQSAPGMPGNAAATMCSQLEAQEAVDGQPWGSLCEKDSNGNVLRVLSPGSYLSIDSTAFSGYFDDYANQVWAQYSTQPLYINTQASAGTVSCGVSGGMLYCDGDNRGYAMPTAQDIFSCSTGTFAIEATDNGVHQAVVPRLCAAFNRATLLISGGNTQPAVAPTDYYTVEPNNMYSKIAHEVEINGEGYAFPYDDVSPSDSENVAGIVASPDPIVLTVTLGG